MRNAAFDLNKVLEVITAFNGEKDYYNLLNVILTKMMEMTNADGGTLYVSDGDFLHYRIVINKSLNIYQGANDEITFAPIPLNSGNIENISAYAALKNETVYIDDVYNEKGFNFTGPKNFDKVMNYHTCSMLVFPLTSTSGGTAEIIGVIQLINASDADTGKTVSFRGVYEPAILQALANISANALANILYAKEIDELLHSFVRVMTRAIDERSVYNINHTNNVAKLCGAFAEFLAEKFPPGNSLHFDKNRLDQLVMAAYLHDIGKIITPLSIMDKADRLADQMEHVLYRFELKKQQLEISFLKGEINEEQYASEIGSLQAAMALVEDTNASLFLPEDKNAKIKELSSITYKSAEGADVPVLTSANIAALSVQKGTLTESERSIMQEHVSITGRLLSDMKFNKYYKDVPVWASRHHEFLDGTGYPEKLENGGTEICILTIMDIYDALVANDRPYKKAMPIEKAHAVLLDMVNEGKLHGELVNLFIESGVWRTEL